MIILVIIGISSWINSSTSKNGTFLVSVVHAALSVLVSIPISSIVCVNVMGILKWTRSIFWSCSYLIWLNVHAWIILTRISWATGLDCCLTVQIYAVLLVIVERRILRLLLLTSLQRSALLFGVNIVWRLLTRSIKVTWRHSKFFHIDLWIYYILILASLMWFLRVSLFTFVATLLVVCILVILLIFNLVSRGIDCIWVYLTWQNQPWVFIILRISYFWL